MAHLRSVVDAIPGHLVRRQRGDMHLPHVFQYMATGSVDLNCSTRWSGRLSFKCYPADHTGSMGASLGTCWICQPDSDPLKLRGTSITWRHALTPRLPVLGNLFN